jgi:glycosyltransferase involved in cell wall biosynthesis
VAAQSLPSSLSHCTRRRWLEVVSHTDPKYGGLSSAVPTLGMHLGSLDFDVSLTAFASPQEHFQPSGYNDENISFWPVSRRKWLQNPSLYGAFRDEVRHADGVHIHGLWEQSTTVAARTARAIKIPYILSAHGMLEPWALASKRLKKLIYGHFIERGNVAEAACLHALTEAEADHYLRFGARSPIAIIPNGVDIPRQRDARLFLETYPSLEGKRIVLFLARLHPKKGIDLLLRAWSKVFSSFPEAHLVLAGPGTEEIKVKMHRFIKDKNLQSSVLITGMLNDKFKWSALSAAECFVLPSFSEGLSISVLEAMGMGLPVLITVPCNMPEVARYKAGWQIEPELSALIQALETILSHPGSTNREIGSRGAELIERQYTWPIIADQMAQLYRWVEGGPRPTSVEFV